ncbi:hypothetical protein HY214_04475 [Candidatus Roizmanbacteria bacterium]|nr:hypothetical protein [Candidatus Roizmanbacteria bacterium]
MKKIFGGLLLIILITVPVSAVNISPSPNQSSSSAEDKEIAKFKDKVATKVAELRQKNNRAVAGTVVSAKTGVFKIKTPDTSEYEIKTDDSLTKYFQIAGTQKKEIKLDEIKTGAYIIVNGVINDRAITANAVFVDEFIYVNSGKITEVNKDDFTVKVITNDKDTVTLDIESSTRQQIINIKSLEIERVGFSKVKEGDTIHFVARHNPDQKDNNRYTVAKFIVIPQEYFIK